MNKNKHFFLPYLIPGTNDTAEKHEKVSHGDQAGPNDHGEETEELLKDWLDADQDEDAEEDGQRRGNGDHKGDMSLNVLPRKKEIDQKQAPLNKRKQSTKCSPELLAPFV